MYLSPAVQSKARRPVLRPLFGLFLVLAVSLHAGFVQADVPNPTVSGPIPVNVPLGDPSRDYPQLATIFDLAGNGYVEEEFFFEGTANEYDVVTAPLSLATVRSSGHPYKTRMIVRRPASSKKFSGVVIVDWLNVSNGYNFDILWLMSREHMMRKGHAYVGVSVQRVGVQFGPSSLKSWSPVRYASLDVTANGRFVQANAGGPNASDALSFDIMAQAGQAIKQPQGIDPLGGLRGERTLIAAGVSQSTNYLNSYYNSIHPMNPVYDGFFRPVNLSGGAYGLFRLPVRTDLPTKTFKINTESDVLLLGEHLVRQPDSDTLRTWEIAGTSHVGFDPNGYQAQILTRDGLPLMTISGCLAGPPMSRVPTARAVTAALDHMVHWVRDDVPPPTAPRIQLAVPSPVPPPPPAAFPLGPAVVGIAARDADGNVLGGLRLSQHSVPTAKNTGVNVGPNFCSLFGVHLPFTPERLTELYPSHGTYVARVVHATVANRKAGYITSLDAIQDILEAAASEIGQAP